jgi:hypothetical protein
VAEAIGELLSLPQRLQDFLQSHLPGRLSPERGDLYLHYIRSQLSQSQRLAHLQLGRPLPGLQHPHSQEAEVRLQQAGGGGIQLVLPLALLAHLRPHRQQGRLLQLRPAGSHALQQEHLLLRVRQLRAVLEPPDEMVGLPRLRVQVRPREDVLQRALLQLGDLPVRVRGTLLCGRIFPSPEQLQLQQWLQGADLRLCGGLEPESVPVRAHLWQHVHRLPDPPRLGPPQLLLPLPPDDSVQALLRLGQPDLRLCLQQAHLRLTPRLEQPRLLLPLSLGPELLQRTKMERSYLPVRVLALLHPRMLRRLSAVSFWVREAKQRQLPVRA